MTDVGVVERPWTAGGKQPGASESTPARGLLFILSGPSGVGKSTLIAELMRRGFPITYCVTATTRPRRESEVNGVHYHFLTDEEFDRLLEQRQFIENAVVHGQYRYGVPLASVREGLRRGRDLIMAPDVQGAETIRRRLPNAITIFLRPPSIDELIPRLAARGTETAEERAIRLRTAEQEMARVSEYDYQVVNYRDRLDEALANLTAIITAERLRVRPRTVEV